MKSGAVKTLWESSRAPENQVWIRCREGVNSTENYSQTEYPKIATSCLSFIKHALRSTLKEKRGYRESDSTDMSARPRAWFSNGSDRGRSEFLLPRVPGSLRKLYVYVYIGVFVPSFRSLSLSLSLSRFAPERLLIQKT